MTNNNNKVIAKNTGFLYLRAIFSLFIKLYSSRLVLDGLGVESFGVYQVVGGIVAMFSFLNTSMSQATMRFLSYALGKDDKDYSQRVFSTSLALHAILALITLLLIETIGMLFLKTEIDIGTVDFDTVVWILHFTAIMLLLTIVTVPFNSLIISKENMGYFAYIDIMTQLLLLGVALALNLFSSDRLFFYGLLVLGVSIIQASVYVLVCKLKYKDFRIKLTWESKLGKEISSFSGWTALAALAAIVQTQGTTVVINMFLGPLVNAALGIANQVNAGVRAFSLNIGVSIGPQIIKSYAQKDYERLNALILSGAKILLLLFIAFSMPLMLEINFFLDIWLVEVPNYAPQLVILLMICSIIDAMTSTYTGAIQATGVIRNYQIVFNTIYLCSLPVMLVLMKYYNYYYVPTLIMIFFSFVTNIVKLPYMIKLIPEFDWKRNVVELFLKIILTIALAIIIPLIIISKMDEGFIRVVIVGLSFELIFAVVVYIYTLDNKEKSLVARVVESLYHKIKK